MLQVLQSWGNSAVAYAAYETVTLPRRIAYVCHTPMPSPALADRAAIVG